MSPALRRGRGHVIAREPEDGPAYDITVLDRIETPDGPLAVIRAVRHAVVRLPACAAHAQRGSSWTGYLDADALQGSS